MEETIKGVHNLLVGLVVLICLRILWDFARAIKEQKAQFNNFGLLGLFVAVFSISIRSVFVFYLVGLPDWASIWMLINLLLLTVSLYRIIKESS